MLRFACVCALICTVQSVSWCMAAEEETGQTIVLGMGELHLDVLVDRLKREFNVEAKDGAPRVAYRETITNSVDKAVGLFKRQTGGSGQFAKVKIIFEPLAEDVTENFTFESKVVGGRVPKEFIPGVYIKMSIFERRQFEVFLAFEERVKIILRLQIGNVSIFERCTGKGKGPSLSGEKAV